MKPAQKKKLLSLFAELYENPATELVFHNEYQLLLCVMLSAQSTDKKVNEITPELFRHYPSFKQLAKARLEDVEALIRQVNYYKTKAKHLIECAKLVESQFGGEIPRSHAELVSLPGVGNKTANVILSELGIAHALAVDTHVFRVSRRLGLASGSTPIQVENELKDQFPPELWRNVHHYLILHGRRVCKAQRPDCSNCSLQRLCPASTPDQ
ncbi:MAG: endonuclease III [Bdellovibrionales bacterium]|nr:endonuclease III [Bdellovibrionales bacterium]